MAGRSATVPSNPHKVAVVIYDGLCTFEFGIAVEIFGLKREEFDFPWYDFHVVSAEKKKVRATGGVTVEADGGIENLSDFDTIIIPGWRDPLERPPEKFLKALRGAVGSGSRVLSICSGVFVLAAAGLLDNKPATTHWRYGEVLKTQYPQISIIDDVLYVDEGNIITSAGSAAGVDACLHLVRCDFGSSVANDVARRMVMPPHRDGGQAQFVPKPVLRPEHTSMSGIMEWARMRLQEPLDLKIMAKQAMMSERTFLRRFRQSVGITPMVWLRRERISMAQELLETSQVSLDQIAEQSGYFSLESFRAAFKKVTGTSPAAYRKRFCVMAV